MENNITIITIDYDDKKATFEIPSDCDTDDWITIIYDDKSIPDRRVYCPAPLPFFTFTNIVAILVIIGVVYVFMERKRK